MNTNTLAFIALCNEYCSLLQNPAAQTVTKLTDNLLRLLPRIYICARDLKEESLSFSEDAWIDHALQEDEYDYLKANLSVLYGENDVYLEVFEEDMKYSDTPVAASISENLADIYQVLYDFMQTARMGTDETVAVAIDAVRSSFKEYWSTALCNVLRALNHLWTNGLEEENPDE